LSLQGWDVLCALIQNSGQKEKLLNAEILSIAETEPTTVSVGNTLQNPIVAGSFSTSFVYTNTQNTNNFTHNYTRPTGDYYMTNDVFYKLTLTKAMTVNIKHCGSQLGDTYLYLLGASGNYIGENDDSSNGCSTYKHAYLTISLSAGVYYVVSEGWGSNGNITTTISGTSIVGDILDVPVNAGKFSNSFQYSNSQNTNNFTHIYTRIKKYDYATKDVFYKFVLNTPMSVSIEHCGSGLSDTYLYLLDQSGNPVDENDDPAEKNLSIYHSHLPTPLIHIPSFHTICYLSYQDSQKCR
jgi:hypothetical protein